MNRRLALTIGLGVLLGARVAAAQEVQIGYQGLPYKASGERETGINLGEGVLMHIGLGAEAGYDSNVFYTSTSAPTPVVGSGIIRTAGFVEINNRARLGGVSPSGLTYSVRAGMMYRRYTNNDEGVSQYKNALMPSAGLSVGTSASHWALGLSDAFVRVEDPPYGAAGAGPIARDNNTASAQAAWSPGGGRISTTFRYNNTIDIFETGSSFQYANNLAHVLMLDVSWKWLPKTAVFLQVSQGWTTYLNPAAGTTGTGKHDSYPLHAVVGLRGLVTPKTSVVAALGYANAFYSSGASTGGVLGSSYVDLQAIVTPTMLSRVAFGYHQDFQNSVISSFYYDYSVYASYVQQLAGRMALDLSGRFSHRQYEGLLFDTTGATRTDNVFLLGASLDYFVRNWIYGGIGYSMVADLSDYTLPGGAPVDYVKHQVFARLGVTY
jgi:hypothetical protein